uniref:CX domain-containing protein n=1 Tax=Parascaris univalens TaxID=6257 RepID=A0A915C353_PARUN
MATYIRPEPSQHGTVGNFIGSTLEGAGSGFIRCVYTVKNIPNATVTLLCEKIQGCCEHQCCPKDQFWMAGVFVLLGFVLLVFTVGSCVLIICYWRSKNEERKEAREEYEYNPYGSQVRMYPGGYATYTGSNVPPRY